MKNSGHWKSVFSVMSFWQFLNARRTRQVQVYLQAHHFLGKGGVEWRVAVAGHQVCPGRRGPMHCGEQGTPQALERVMIVTLY